MQNHRAIRGAPIDSKLAGLIEGELSISAEFQPGKLYTIKDRGVTHLNMKPYYRRRVGLDRVRIYFRQT